MSLIEDNISVFIEEQVPDVYYEGGENFIAFIKAYYEWMEDTGNVLDLSRNLLEYHDIDKTIDSFIEHFKQTYLSGFPLNTAIDTKTLIKHIMDMYRSKGSPRSVELLFRLVFNEDIELYYPGDDIFTTSEGDYYQPIYLEVISEDLNYLISLDGREIQGSNSGAKAFVESIATKITNQKVVHVLYLSNVRGTFSTGELVTNDGLLDGAPQIVGSLSSITITIGGSNNLVGDTFDVISDVGKQGKARVTDIEDGTGRVAFSILDGGWGYTTNGEISVVKINTAYLNVNNVIQTEMPHDEIAYEDWPIVQGTGSVVNNNDGTWLFTDSDVADFRFRIQTSLPVISLPPTYDSYDIEITFRRGTHTRTTFFVDTDGIEKRANINWSSNTVTETTVTGPTASESLTLSYEWNGDDVTLRWVLTNDSTLSDVGFRIYGDWNTAETGNFTIVGPVIFHNSQDSEWDRFETVVQPLEQMAYISGTDVTDNYTLGDYIHGIASDGSTVIANGTLLAATTNGANGVLTICVTEGTFGNQQTLAFSGNTEPFEDGERVIEGDVVNLPWTSKTGTISVSDVVTGNQSGAVGVVSVSNSTVIQVDDAFGDFTVGEVVNVDGSNYFTADDVQVVNTGASATITAIINSTALSIADITGAFDSGREIRGERTVTSATAGTTTDSGVAYIFLNGTNTQNAVPSDITIANVTYDAFTNSYVTGNLIGFDTSSLGLWGNTSSFSNSAFSFVYGESSNTHANVVSVGTGQGADFDIGTISDTETLSLYTDFISDNTVANVSFLDVVINGSNSGTGFVDSFSVTSGGSGYVNGQTVSFTGGGLADGEPEVPASANIQTDGAGAITSITVISGGQGYYKEPSYTLPTGTGAVTSIVMDFGYGFSKDPNCDFDNIIDNCLTFISETFGTIESLTSINPGFNYNNDPFLSVYTEPLVKFDKRDLIINIENLVGSFTVGERLTQQVTVPGVQLTVTDVQNSTPATDTMSNSFAVGEGIVQVVNATVNTYGTIYSFDDTDKMTVVNVREADATGAEVVYDTNVTFNTTDDILGLGSGGTANVTVSSNTSNLVEARGRVTSSDSEYVYVERTSFNATFGGGSLLGETSGATADVLSVVENQDTDPIGDNAVISANVESASGIVVTMEVIDSGYGYEDGASLTLVPDDANNVIIVTGIASVEQQGVGIGYWRNTKSTLSVDKYLHDNDFYQEYSYQVKSGLSLDKYRELIERVLHVAGTKLFGQVVKSSTGNMDIAMVNSHILVTYANTDTQIYTANGAE